MLNYADLEQRIENFLQAEHVPGLALAIVQGEEILYARGFGRTSVEDESIPVTPRTLFRIGSTTKPLTGTAIMRLVEMGKLDLDTPVQHYVRTLRLSDASATEQVTLRMLLSHTSGLPTRYQPFGQRDPNALEAWVQEELPLLPLVAPPGSVFSYSNPGINLAGYVAQVASGKSYGELMAEYVFAPLDMHRTTFDPLVAMTYPIALSHTSPDGNTLQVEHRFAESSGHHPSGYAISNVLDLANFAIMQMHGGRFHGRQVLTADSVRLMQQPYASLYTPTGAGYGLTFQSDTYKGVRVVEHNGDVNSFNSCFLMAPDARVAIIILVNWYAGIGELANHILDELLQLPQQVSEAQEIATRRTSWPQYVGCYTGQFGLAKILIQDDQLVLDMNGDLTPLKAYSQDTYFGENEKEGQKVTVGFVPAEQGPTRFIMINGFFPYQRITEQSLSSPDLATWGAYTGTYAAPFETFTVKLDEGQLLLKSQIFGFELPCRPLDRTRFTSPVGLIEFRDIQDGKASLLVQRDAYFFTRV